MIYKKMLTDLRLCQEDLITIRALKIKPLYARPWAEQVTIDFVDFNSLTAELLVGCGNV